MCYLKFFAYIALTIVAVSGWSDGKLIDKNLFYGDSERRKTVIIDTDAGSDDGVAILNILGAEDLLNDVQIKFITTVNGNTMVKNVAQNVLKILQTAERLDIPVYKGANQSILTTPQVDNYFGKDGFGDFHFPNPPSMNLIKDKHAVNALIDEATLQPGELTLVCLGPLTNVALAIRLDDKFLSKLKEIYILGGSDSAVGNVAPGVEFNFYMDPEAAAILFKEALKANKILNLLPWETVSSRSVIDMDWRKNVLGTVKSQQISMLNRAENITLVGDKWISADSMLSAVVINKQIVEESEIHHAEVEVNGALSRGALFIDYEDNTKLPKNMRLLKKINIEKFKEMLLQNLNPWEGERSGDPSQD